MLINHPGYVCFALQHHTICDSLNFKLQNKKLIKVYSHIEKRKFQIRYLVTFRNSVALLAFYLNGHVHSTGCQEH